MEFRILGSLEVRDAGVAVSLGGPRHRVLLAVLLLHAGEVVSSDRLIKALWGDVPPRSAREMLHVRVSELRRMLRAPRPGGVDVLLTRRPGYLLAVDPDELDARRFEHLAGVGRQALARGNPETAAATLREALVLWRGPALADVADQPFARAEVARLEALRLRALEDRIEADLLAGCHADVTDELEALVAEHPLRERFWYQLMLARYRSGRQAEALQAYEHARRLLAEELGIDPGAELRYLHTAILRQDPALRVSDRSTAGRPHEPPNNLPIQLASFVGREWELAEVRMLLTRNRLVTLTGVGGAGKSRLAVETARTSTADHPDGTWLVELATLSDPDLVVDAVATVFGVHEHPERPRVDLLAEHVRSARALLILDNCEHLVEAVAALVQRLLATGRHLRILATSRERLSVPGEALWQVSGLDVPEPGLTKAAAVARADATRLFSERAAAVQPQFVLSDVTAGAVAQICQQLDGLPLAIELAAARMSALGADQIAARLDDRFRLLTHGNRTALPRHQTLRGVVEWSYGLLNEPERRLFDRLAVFVGGFTLEAVETVCSDPDADDVAILLARLVDKSLVTVETVGTPTPRYRLLETLRAFALERLHQRGETRQLCNRHALHFRALAEAAADVFRGPEQPVWTERLETEHGNLRAALESSMATHDTETAARLVGSLYPFWDVRGHYAEGRRWLARVLAMGDDVPGTARARALLGVATLAVIQGDLRQAENACEEAATLFRTAGDAAGVAHTTQYLGFVAICNQELDRAAELLDKALRVARSVGAVWSEGWSLLFLATLALARGDHDRASARAAECERVLRSVGDQEGIAWALLIRGTAALGAGSVAHALGPLRAGIQAFQAITGLWGLSLGLFVAAQLARARHNWRRMATLLGASEALRKSIGAAKLPFVKAWIDEMVAKGVALDREMFERSWRAGQALAADAAVRMALHELDAPLVDPAMSK